MMKVKVEVEITNGKYCGSKDDMRGWRSRCPFLRDDGYGYCSRFNKGLREDNKAQTVRWEVSGLGFIETHYCSREVIVCTYHKCKECLSGKK